MTNCELFDRGFDFVNEKNSRVRTKMFLFGSILLMLGAVSMSTVAEEAPPGDKEPVEANEMAARASGDYVGDCLSLRSKIDGLPAGKKEFFVTEQDDQNENNPKLTLVEAGDDYWIPGYLSCSPKKSIENPAVTVDASALSKSGAIRRGYAFGLLTTPYKYYPSKKKFTSSAPIGAYLGWRHGQPGSAMTYALAVTMGSVQADSVVLDENNKLTVTGNTDVTALSGAMGVIFDISRGEAGKNFKAGILVGKDFVNESDSVSYEFNRKTWVAIQIGYDFTDS